MPHETSRHSHSKGREESSKEHRHRHRHRSSSEAVSEKRQPENTPGTLVRQTVADSKGESGPACENCSSSVSPSGMYCLACDLLLCQACDRTVHAPPALSKHDRRPFEEAALRRKACRFHINQQISHFCLYCNTFLCKICLDEGLHQISPHVVNTLDDAIQKKTRGLLNLVNGPLRQRYEALQHEAVRIEGLMQKVRNAAGEIEAQVREHYEGVLARLARSEKEKLALCQSDLTTIKGMLKQIDDVEHYVAVDHYRKDPIVLLSQAGTISESVRSILARRLCDAISVTEENIRPTDLPREPTIGISREGEAKEDPCMSRLNIPDGITSKCTMYQDNVGTLLSEAEQEILHWKALVEQYAFELAAWDMTCSRCGQHCLPETINSPCIVPSKRPRREDRGLGEELCSNGSLFQEDSDNHSRRHFFVHSEDH
ncbi:Hypothetical protein GLP15_1796 [Giardia lamblia P15]|uniref:B box-type domain-containing protein n=1 Tax=Giardia intestinalis (strain P15) TaxID=658858 RepID=E1EW50_GIAIA|nr:Hypothetical protein GLP15_1796 [Giardia lamblia P15]